jgi:hypothetical protein
MWAVVFLGLGRCPVTIFPGVNNKLFRLRYPALLATADAHDQDDEEPDNPAEQGECAHAEHQQRDDEAAAIE